MRLLPILALLGAVASLLAGCGGGDSSAGTTQPRPDFQNVRINYQGVAGPEDAGLAMAEELGYLQEDGIGAWINSPIYPERPTKYVDEELVDAALVHEPQVVLADANEGRQIVIVGSLVSEPTMAMIWLPESGIEDVADLKGKTIAYPGVPFQKEFLKFVLESAGLAIADVKLENVDNDLVPALVKGRADAIFGGSGNAEGVLLESRGLKPVLTPATELGIPDYDELVLIARRDRYAKDPGMFERMLQASIRGNGAAGDEPQKATEALVDQSFDAIPAKPTEAGIEATAPLLSTTGDVDRAKLEDLIDWMYEQGMMKRKLQASEVLASP
jgi:putative hydroxymethylpyrimidine transport system substrate-binding protein